MTNTKIIPVNAFTLSDLQVLSIGYNHDHCKTLYFGTADNLSKEYLKYSEKGCKYIAIFEEDIPLSKTT